MLLFFPPFKKNKNKKYPIHSLPSVSQYFVCLFPFPALFLKRDVYTSYCQIFSFHVLLNPLPIRPLSAPFSLKQVLRFSRNYYVAKYHTPLILFILLDLSTTFDTYLFPYLCNTFFFAFQVNTQPWLSTTSLLVPYSSLLPSFSQTS